MPNPEIRYKQILISYKKQLALHDTLVLWVIWERRLGDGWMDSANAEDNSEVTQKRKNGHGA